MRAIWRHLVLSIAVVALLGTTGCGDGGKGPAESASKGATEAKETLKVGGLWAMTGIAQSFGKNSKAVFDLAVDEINGSGGVELADGRKVPLEAVVYDEGCPSPETGIAAARKAAGDPVLIMLGPTCSSVAEPVFGILQKTLDDSNDTGLQLPFFTDTAIKAGLAKISPWAFRNTPSEAEMYGVLFQHLKETTAYKTVAVGTEVDFAHSKSTADNAIKPAAQKAGYSLVADEGWKLTDTDFSTQAAKIREAKPDVVVAAAHPFTTCGFLKELGRQGFKPKTVVALTSSLTAETTEGCPKEAEGMIGPSSFAPINPGATAIADKAAKQYKGFVDLHSSPVYENLMMLKGLLKAAGVEGRPDTVATDRRRIRDQLEKTTGFDGLLGPITFKHDLGGEVDKPWLVCEIKKGKIDARWIPPQFEAVIEKS
jgi:branched-chain amino acid transport system substrate-binding protein